MNDPRTEKQKAIAAAMAETIEFGMKLKAKMIRLGKRSGKATCPRCSGRVRAVLAGRKNHLHMACETDGCSMRMME